MKGIKGTCSHCKKKNIEVKKVFNYMLCQRCWAGTEEKVRNQYPVFKLNFIQRIALKLSDRIKQMGRAKKRVMTTRQCGASNRR